jgi:hypothetical protein
MFAKFANLSNNNETAKLKVANLSKHKQKYESTKSERSKKSNWI